MSVVDPRQPKTGATVKKTPDGPILLVHMCAADMTADLLETIIENTAERVMQKIREERTKADADSTLQTLP